MTEQKKTSTGYGSTGYGSTGDWSTGIWSTGNGSTGYGSTGEGSTGNGSTGNWSTGYGSTGYCSISNGSPGHFSTIDGQPSFFDKPFNGTWAEALELIPHVELKLGAYWVVSSEMTEQQKADHPTHEKTGGVLLKYNHTYHQAWEIAWSEMAQATKDRFLNLPNFDAEKFKQITGIDTTTVQGPRNVTVIDGKTYRMEKLHGELYQVKEEV